MKVKKYLAAAIISVSGIARGATIVVPVRADTTLFEFFPTYNMGAAMLGAGAINLAAAESGKPARMHALMRFDLGEIPAGATITVAELSVTALRVPAGTPLGCIFELHRMLKDWGEGAKVSVNQGEPADEGEATWLAPMHPSPAWTEGGASGADDSQAAISSSLPMDALGAYTFPSTPDVVADVQSWVANPASN